MDTHTTHNIETLKYFLDLTLLFNAQSSPFSRNAIAIILACTTRFERGRYGNDEECFH
jgi:hypothetical protein